MPGEPRPCRSKNANGIYGWERYDCSAMKKRPASRRKKPVSDSRQTSLFPRVLIVEDDEDILNLSAETLKETGYEVDTAKDGAAGWEALQAKRYGLLITDHSMPIMNGGELVRKLRAAGMTLPVIMFTGRLPEDKASKNQSLQLAALLPKPFSLDELVETVKTALGASQR